MCNETRSETDASRDFGPFELIAKTNIRGIHKHILQQDKEIYDPGRDWENNVPDGYQEKRPGSYPMGMVASRREIWSAEASQGWCGWPYSSLGWPFALHSWEGERMACSFTNFAGGKVPAEISITNLDSGAVEIANVQGTVEGAKRFRQDQLARDLDGYRPFFWRGAGSFDDLVFVIGLSNKPYTDEKAKGFVASDVKAMVRIFVIDTRSRQYKGYSDFDTDNARSFFSMTDQNGQTAFYGYLGSDGYIGSKTHKHKRKSMVVRWVGSREKPAEGGNLDNGWSLVSDEALNDYGSSGANTVFRDAENRDRVAITTWTHPHYVEDPQSYKGNVLLVSDAYPTGGWTEQQPFEFKQVFDIAQYEPGLPEAAGSKLDAVGVADGHLYFGTYHQGFSAAFDYFQVAYPELYASEFENNRKNRQELMKNTWRGISIFRFKLSDLDRIISGDKDVSLLYGYEAMTLWDQKEQQFVEIKNGLNQKPLYGSAGLGYEGNIYSWVMFGYRGKMFFGSWDVLAGTVELLDGTADFSGQDNTLTGGTIAPVVENWEQLRDESDTKMIRDYIASRTTSDRVASGANLFVFDDSDSPARPLTINGFGNQCNNGVRYAVEADSELYFATSSWCNLTSDAGIELLKYLPEKDE